MRRLLVIVAALAAASMAFTSCEEEKHYYVKNIGDGAQVPSMSTLDVVTLISDSGYTKYNITTPLWNMYEEADNPFWFFPEGLKLEQYNTNMDVESTLRCDSAKYLTGDRIWRLDGHVVMVNVMRDTFLTNQVFWDQVQRKLYSDSFIHIVRQDRVIEGYGFESNETMTAYLVNRPTGIFPVEQKKEGGATRADDDPDATFNRDVRRAKAPKRASQRNAEENMLFYHN